MGQMRHQVLFILTKNPLTRWKHLEADLATETNSQPPKLLVSDSMNGT